MSILNFAFFAFAFIGVSGGIAALMYARPGTIKIALFIANLAALAALYHLYMAVQVWLSGSLGITFARVRYSFVTLAALALAWFYLH